MNWATFWSAAASVTSFGLLIVTGIYAWLTHRMAVASERQSWEIARPRLVVAIRTNQGGQFFLLHIENVGLTPAENLSLRLDRPVHQTFGAKSNLNDIPAFKGLLRALPPRTPMRFGLSVAHVYLSPDLDRTIYPLNFVVEAKYRSGLTEINEKFPIDIQEQLSFSSVERNYLEDFGRTFPEKFDRASRDIKRVLEDISRIPAPGPIRRRSWAIWFKPKKSDDFY